VISLAVIAAVTTNTFRDGVMEGGDDAEQMMEAVHAIPAERGSHIRKGLSPPAITHGWSVEEVRIDVLSLLAYFLKIGMKGWGHWELECVGERN
jgi:hypothetical protein